ncbi:MULTISPECIES: PTS mannose/fructose/sorbose/N-acetylgalactosamine transporter subunit IIC [Streptococcus]|jgi:PTS system, IIc component|uniref:PTS system sorbose-specific iic component family protein n=1 Tax=Streptococcus mitis TaxID=28037 RepID=A0A081QLJ1_STRMT|nr:MULTISPECIES: PTS mannose/fructose/sorbose/N-acetylgalactosamine transporter subunit IIC [Streptococcus]RKV81338.1 MAG: PTS mannose/fructose/sorbose/N-acetylgalactosamine transporter subunit IIC [Streptococcus sp.]KEQ43814.1 PTS system sorbose-specific iic component family protein [Streptococcus mitis]MDG7108163.1 PTS mannose/fructose/sorbose/N-acetylgalactosamine transporter subunit IIC [Streptococcus pneumoniae]MDG7112623.1 PTS mannose/fructose/sorbose/N-acetylgalactosamine transporter sub
MLFTQALLVTLVGIIATIDYNGPLFMIHRPLVTSAMVGLVLGDFTQGVLIGSALELTWLGVTGIGGYTPPDTISGAIIGTAFGILSGQGETAGIAIAVPIAVATQQLDVLAKTLDVYFVKKADNDAKNGDYSKIGFYHYSSLILITLFKIVPIFLAIMLGGEYVADLFAKVPPIVMQGLNSAGALLPSIGFGMLLNMMLKKNMWVFLLIGFICSVYGGMSTIGISLVGIAVAYFYDMIGSKPQETTSNSDVEEDLDL